MISPATKRQSINPGATRAMYDALHFSQATRVGNMIWVSGQVGIDAAMKPATGMEAQAHLAFQGLRSVLEAAGASLADVVELMTFHGESPLRRPYLQHVRKTVPPAAAALSVLNPDPGRCHRTRPHRARRAPRRPAR